MKMVEDVDTITDSCGPSDCTTSTEIDGPESAVNATAPQAVVPALWMAKENILKSKYPRIQAMALQEQVVSLQQRVAERDDMILAQEERCQALSRQLYALRQHVKQQERQIESQAAAKQAVETQLQNAQRRSSVAERLALRLGAEVRAFREYRGRKKDARPFQALRKTLEQNRSPEYRPWMPSTPQDPIVEAFLEQLPSLSA